jgi:hypothetical protein
MEKTFNASGFIYTVNGRRIREWGKTENPVVDTALNPKYTVVRGQGGDAVIGQSAAPGVQHVISVLRGSKDSAFLNALFQSDEPNTLVVTYNQLGTLEGFASQEGIITNRGDFSSGSGSVEDDTYTIEFNRFIQTRGGS